ncbi:transposase family protein [Streptomyces sp. NRRL WC-3723]|uniref:transposase family protein n=1 Tax=Streptomyces sp. NRRL WC-3723 TaxID=1519491 RepID=UPI000A6ADF9A|nr:transposase family protein [Streptomyces sp. NRRL WC-3723]
MLAERGCTVSPGVRLRTLAEVIDHLGANRKTGIIDGTEIRVRRTQGPGQVHLRQEQAERGQDHGRHGRERPRALLQPDQPGSCADITHARQAGLVKLLADGPAVEILADAGYQGLGAQTGGRVITPPHRKFKKNAPDWYEEIHERQRKAHSSRRIRVEHGIAHLKNWRALARHLGRREHMSDTVQAVAGLLSHQQTADLTSARQR